MSRRAPTPAAGPATPPRRARRTQAERSARTQAQLLDASVACLIDKGYAGTTTLAVCKRAGVSHGSLLHHFGTRERLLGATLDAAYTRLRAPVVEALAGLPEGDARVEAMVDLMWSAFGAPEFKAVLELWLAAANNPEVSWSVWDESLSFDAGILPLAQQLFPEVAARLPDFPVYVSLLFQVMQGMGLAAATFPQTDAPDLRGEVRALLSSILCEAFRANPRAG